MSISLRDLPDDVVLLSDSEWTTRDDRHRHGESISTTGILSSSQPLAIAFGDAVLDFDEPPPDWSREVIDSVCELGSLPRNWDSYGARPIDPYCALAAIELILSVLDPEHEMPEVIPTSRGGVQLEWHCGGIDLEIEILSRWRFQVSYEDKQVDEEFESADFRKILPLIDRIPRLNLA